MDQHRPTQQNQPFKNSAKSFAKISAVILLAAGVACSGKKVVPQGLGSASSPPPAKVLDISSTLGAKLTTVGENFSPRLSPGGGEFLFLSQSRATHQQTQVYVYDLSNLAERRVTYQDGQCDSPIFIKQSGDIVYTSTTDEIKERPSLLRKDNSNEIPSELYLSDINGSNIRRLTKHPGFDGNPVDRPGKLNAIYFSEQSPDGAKKIMQMNLNSDQPFQIIAKKGISIEEFTPSATGKKWLWVENDLEKKQSSLWLAEKIIAKAQALKMPQGQYQDFSWIDDSHLLLSAKLEGKKNFELMTYETDKKCLRPFLADKSNLTEPQLTSNQRSLIFVSDIGGKRQIYYRSVSLDWSAACLNAEVEAPAPAPTPTTTTTTTVPAKATSTTSTLAPASTTTSLSTTTTTVPAAKN